MKENDKWFQKERQLCDVAELKLRIKNLKNNNMADKKKKRINTDTSEQIKYKRIKLATNQTLLCDMLR